MNTHQIVERLLLDATTMDDMSLFHGKMGIAIALYHYDRKYTDYFVRQYCDEIIEQIIDKKNLDDDLSFEKGLAGIAWGICYLLQNKFIETDSPLETLEDIDKAFLKYSYSRFQDKSLKTGLGGILIYIRGRQQLAEKYEEETFFPKEFITEILQAKPFTTKEEDQQESFAIDMVLEKNLALGSIQSTKTGLDGGYAGYILKNSLI